MEGQSGCPFAGVPSQDDGMRLGRNVRASGCAAGAPMYRKLMHHQHGASQCAHTSRSGRRTGIQETLCLGSPTQHVPQVQEPEA